MTQEFGMGLGAGMAVGVAVLRLLDLLHYYVINVRAK